MGHPKSINDINAMDYEDFISHFGNAIENCSLIAAAVWRFRPFNDVVHLHEALCSFVDDLPVSVLSPGQEGILRSHPDLAGRVAAAGALTAESTLEQRSAGLSQLTTEERVELTDLNERYRGKFGFPFVVCARQNKKNSIFEGLRARLNNSTEEEVAKGVQEVKKICYLRLLDLVVHEGIESKY
ncbi:2-oxo-4-hydroxy-4-carboxy-5-ureidoimidazoline decarboxylase-like isoform X1 [Penaeus chinensis]|uniref:2-oxo-4-hydroxy-4-carboxy-5-ureidoimidazoline decarboxylase-like isoform X1 n=1 Tax=Penaeus chinensis TaxID=139456 RepID=UPI001FB8154E|nr:2-oxo-4-hydroxy-4-carboxy-5-ureidoimidazoline decarboxylase-like isoform X1 [Penaeus chinensis]